MIVIIKTNGINRRRNNGREQASGTDDPPGRLESPGPRPFQQGKGTRVPGRCSVVDLVVFVGDSPDAHKAILTLARPKVTR